MYNIKKTDYGYHLTFEGMVKHDEAQKWFDESKKMLENSPNSFGVLIDMRNADLLSSNSQSLISSGQHIFRQNGMERVSVILNSEVNTRQSKRLAKESGAYEYERFIDASSRTNWEKTAIDWIKFGADPDN